MSGLDNINNNEMKIIRAKRDFWMDLLKAVSNTNIGVANTLTNAQLATDLANLIQKVKERND